MCTSSLSLKVNCLHFPDITLQWLIQHSKSRRSWEYKNNLRKTQTNCISAVSAAMFFSCHFLLTLWRTVFHSAHSSHRPISQALAQCPLAVILIPWWFCMCPPPPPKPNLRTMPLKSWREENVSHVLVYIVHFWKPVGSPKLKPKVTPATHPLIPPMFPKVKLFSIIPLAGWMNHSLMFSGT